MNINDPKFKPMLSGKAPDDLSKINFDDGIYVSPKLDGIRAIVRDGVVLTRSLKPVPNKHVQTLFGKQKYNGFDGELVVGKPTGIDVMNRTQSGVMAVDGEPDVYYHVFDIVGPDIYRKRFLEMASQVSLYARKNDRLVPVDHIRAISIEELMQHESYFVAQGYEGAMIRAFGGLYKFGRSTTKEGGLLKMKRWDDLEARIIGFNEEMYNGNAAKVNALGRTERSSHKDNKEGKNRLGSFICELIKDGESIEFKAGSGLDEATSLHIWQNRDSYLNKLAKIKHQGFTPDGSPRFPTYLGIRDELDIS